MAERRPDDLTPERWARAQAAFLEAADRTPVSRDRVLAAVCGDDGDLRRLVERMLAVDSDASLRLGPLPHAAPDDAPAPVAGRRVGPYRILREIGRGGMGTVYLAERDDVGRRVALKLVRGGLAAPERVARFLVERRVLARLDHPLVARLLDAGVAEDGTPEAGTPWFAMEYVDGEPIDRYCDARRLTVAARLLLVEQVCEAVAYAHRNLVVHRDLKPGNLLVTAAGDVKLLDFGIAKMLASDDGRSDGPGLTEAGVRVMTPEYAAPEQARGEPVTTATDVYSLGVVLHELLAGTRPSRRARPSQALAASAATARGTTPERLRRQLEGDLDTIALKALDPDADRRYASAAALLDDLRRQRTGFPVRARPDGRAYRTRAFVRRNRWAVAAAAGAFALLAGVAGLTTVQQARTARALDTATAEAAKARQVTQFVTSLFRGADPYAAGAGAAPPDTSAALLGASGERLERQLARQPAVRAELLHTLAVVQRNLGHWDLADTLLRRGLAARRETLGAPDRPDVELAGLLHDLGVVRRLKSDVRSADTLLGQALAMRDALAVGAGAERAERVAELAATRYELAIVRRYQARYADGERLVVPAIATLRRTPGPALADALDQRAALRVEMQDPEAGATYAREAIAVRERWEGPDHPAVAQSYRRLSHALRNAGHIREAEQAIRHALAIQRARLSPEHPDVVESESELSWVLIDEGDYAEAERIQRRLLAFRRRTIGDYSRDAAGSFYTLGVVRHRQGALAESAELLRGAIAANGRAFGMETDAVVAPLEELTVVEAQRGRDADALAAATLLLRARHTSVWDAAAQPLALAASLLAANDDCHRAGPWYRRAVEAYAARHPDARADDLPLVRVREEEAACRRGVAAAAETRAR